MKYCELFFLALLITIINLTIEEECTGCLEAEKLHSRVKRSWYRPFGGFGRGFNPFGFNPFGGGFSPFGGFGAFGGGFTPFGGGFNPFGGGGFNPFGFRGFNPFLGGG